MPAKPAMECQFWPIHSVALQTTPLRGDAEACLRTSRREEDSSRAESTERVPFDFGDNLGNVVEVGAERPAFDSRDGVAARCCGRLPLNLVKTSAQRIVHHIFKRAAFSQPLK